MNEASRSIESKKQTFLIHIKVTQPFEYFYSSLAFNLSYQKTTLLYMRESKCWMSCFLWSTHYPYLWFCSSKVLVLRNKLYSWICPRFRLIPAVVRQFTPISTGALIPFYYSACKYFRFFLQSNRLKRVYAMFGLIFHCLSSK